MKKAVSFILAAIMLIMLPAGAFADSARCSCDTPPVVMVNGFGTELYHDNGDGTQSAVFPMGAVEIVSAIPSLAGAFAALAAGEHELFRTLLSKALFRLMGNMMCNPDGTAKISARSYQTPTDTDIHKKTPTDSIRAKMTAGATSSATTGDSTPSKVHASSKSTSSRSRKSPATTR